MANKRQKPVATVQKLPQVGNPKGQGMWLLSFCALPHQSQREFSDIEQGRTESSFNNGGVLKNGPLSIATI